ncbi:OB-fold protein [Seonamhaeicola aphaedonensis]|uniref:Putative nucleic acid binding protein n=1 Tax=Seonamhaeicola aphaedonensis TaxID=1461338 RepID=A0A3D9H8W3_9FLAO|nr:hypothetical protein [Seonamhaeicola aphaedonensis]RED45933.1 putative nucleic acid binding protein [Seonamhaeicola aphaedonensis]
MRKYIILLVLLILGIIGYNYIYQEHRNISTESPEHILTADSLFNQFSENPSDSEKNYLNKTIEVSGVISEMGESNLVLNKKIFCQFKNLSNRNLPTNKIVKIKGRFLGYDELLEEVKLDQCVFVNH